jgi:hypothetical protein
MKMDGWRSLGSSRSAKKVQPFPAAHGPSIEKDKGNRSPLDGLA